MRAILILFFTILMGINSAFAYELVLPKEKKTYVNTDYAFFVGKANKLEEISINDERIYVAPNGAFAHSIKLKEGENRIVMKSNFNTQVYRFYKNAPEQNVEPELIELVPKTYQVLNDNTPLRSTPVDFGMNRISHLFAGTNLVIDGRKGEFYRVFLSKTKEAWIKKESVVLASADISPKFITMDSEAFKNASKHRIEFSEKLPYTIEESDKEVVFKVYNPFVSNNSVYTMNIRKPEKYSYETFSNKGTYVFKVSELPKVEKQSLEGLTIVVDAGHGGSEKGAVGCLGDLEKDINLKIANELKNILTTLGATVVMTRECDGNVSLDDRVRIAKENCSNIFISIHLNSIPDIKFDLHKNKGTSVYYYNENSKGLAKCIEKSVVSGLGTRNDGVRTASFAVLRPTEYISVLAEVAYMTNPIDSVMYIQEDFSCNAANAIADGLVKYLTEEK